MRITSLILPITVCLATIGGYAAGYYMGEADGREAGADAMFNLDASRSAEALVLASNVRLALRESKPVQAELAVVRYAALKVPSLVACHSSPDCAASVGPLLPRKAQLEEALAADRAMRGQRNEPRH